MVADKFPNGLIGPNRPYYLQNFTSISKINLLSEGVRLGLSQKKIPRDST